MAKPRQKPSGQWEIGLRHPSLPGGRKYFSFDTEERAADYARQWRLMKSAGIAPPSELLKAIPKHGVILATVLRDWINSGLPAKSQLSPLGSLVAEVGAVRLEDVTYKWLTAYIQRLKVENNLSPSSIKHRIQALSRAIDEYLRNHETLVFRNPAKILPKGYSTYSHVDAKLAQAAGGEAKANLPRDRRLLPGEHEKIVAALSGWERDDRQRGLLLKGGNQMLTMYLLIVNTGLRLKEAYTLTRGQIDLERKVIRAQNSKQWRGKVSFREIPMRQGAYSALRDYLANRPMLPGAYLFPIMDEGLPLKKVSQRLSASFRIAFEYCGLEGLHIHDMRHEATCQWLELRDNSGNVMFRLEEVNKIMGWSINSTMAQRYASFRGEDFVKRLWVIDDAIAVNV